MIIYADKNSTRLRYIIDVLFGEEVIIQQLTHLPASATGCIYYTSEKPANGGAWIRPHILLYEENINWQSIKIFEWNNLPAFFETGGDIPFDIFAATFYLLCRYEEYLPHEVDKYGRFNYVQSLAYSGKFIHLPLINLWLLQFKKEYGLNSWTMKDDGFSFQPTYDIDVAFAFRHQSFFKNSASLLKNLLSGKIMQTTHHIKVLTRMQQDPYDVYEWLQFIHQKYALSPVYFFLLSKNNRGLDKNISPRSTGLKNLVFNISEKFSIGIHPSLQSGANEKVLKQEIQTLNALSGKPVLKSRHHYLKFNLPETYETLISKGIQHDYSMGYGSENGFRASYCKPFKWFNLKQNKTTSLVVHPFCFMDSTAIFHRNYNAGLALQELQQLHDVIKKVSGKMIIIFHNHLLANNLQRLPWRMVFEKFLEKNCIKK